MYTKITTRQAAVAGSFYPDKSSKLRDVLDHLLKDSFCATPCPKAIIAPHAGYIYSGAIAASAYSRIISGQDSIRRVVLIGPSHRVAFSGLAICSAQTFMTPLGKVPVDYDACQELMEFPQVRVINQAHAFEHSLEVQLPFLTRILYSFSIIPLLTGNVSAESVGSVLNSLWNGPETLFVISSDLSHYLAYDTARQLDLATAKAIEEMKPEKISHAQACGRTSISGLLNAAQAHGLTAKTVDLRNSGDTAGTRDRVVGYGAFVIE